MLAYATTLGMPQTLETKVLPFHSITLHLLGYFCKYLHVVATFVDLAHDGNLQELLVILLVVET